MVLNFRLKATEPTMALYCKRIYERDTVALRRNVTALQDAFADKPMQSGWICIQWSNQKRLKLLFDVSLGKDFKAGE